MKKILVLGLTLLFGLVGFWSLSSQKKSSFDVQRKLLRVGVTAGPHAVIMEKVRDLASQQGLSLEIIEFNDFILPNAALAQGDLDVNCYQHQPFLDEQVKARGYSLHSIIKTVLMPIAIYSKKYRSIQDIPDKSTIAIPNDPTNSGRALLLLQKVGLIKLKKSDSPTLLDVENFKNLTIKELDAPNLPATLADVDAAVINTDWIFMASLDPQTALAVESIDSPYTNVMVVRQGFEQDSRVQALVKIYQSSEVKHFIQNTFQGAVIPAW